MSCKFEFKGETYTESEILEVLSKDPEIIAAYAVQEEREGLDYTPEDMKTFSKKVDKLKSAMDVEVILDPNVPTSRVLAKSDPRTKAAGKPVILINPEAIFKTTAIHEFAHIFIDAFPRGMKNPRIIKALKQLEGTALEAEVKALYPELTQEMLNKEILATAIGREGAQIWDNTENASKFEAFKNWFFDFLKRTFGLNKDQVQNLTRDLLSEEVNENILENLSDQTQEQRHTRNFSKEKEEFKEKKKSIDKVYEETLNRVLLAHQSLIPTDKERRKTEKIRRKAGVKTRLSSIEELKQSLEEYQVADKKKGLFEYIFWAQNEINYMQTKIDERKTTDRVTDENIIKSLNWNNTFSMIEDIQNLIETMFRNGDIKTTEERDYIQGVLAGIQGERSKIETSLLEMSRESYAQLMADNDNKIYERFKAGFAKEYDELVKASGPQNQTKEEYLVDRMNDARPEIRQIAYEENLQAAERSVSDLKWHAAALFSEKDANSRDIQVLSVLVDERELKISRFAASEAEKFDKWEKDYRKDFGSQQNQKKKYENMFEESKSGQAYYTSEYSPDFYEERNDELQKRNNADWYNEEYKDYAVDSASLEYTSPDGKKGTLKFDGGKNINVPVVEDGTPVHITYQVSKDEIQTISLEQAIARSEYQKWVEENTEIKKVGSKRMKTPRADKWASENWKNLTSKQKDHLFFLTGKIRHADTLYGNQKSLVKKAYGQEWLKLPSVLKSDIGRIAEGQTKDFFSRKISSMIQTQEDEFDEGNRTEGEETGDLKDSARIYADITNKEKLRTPIAFRAKLEAKDQSLDLHTITLMNLVNAKNHKEKTDLESTFLVVLDVMKHRSVAQHKGAGRLSKVHALTGKQVFSNWRDGLSKESLKAMDILENRIYGIKNKESGKLVGNLETHKLAQTWLKYSGTLALVGNYANSIINTSMGTISNFIEAVGGETYSIRDWKNAGIDYWKDMPNILNDMGRNVATSKTNLLMNVLNVMGGKEYLESNFERSSRVSSLMNADSLRPVAKMGEHMMQAKVMYAVLKSIKAMNEKGQYLDANGKVVKNKKDAAGLDKMITFKKMHDGGIKMEIDPKVKATSFTSTGGHDQILLETRNLIKHKVIELHGLYDSDIQAAVQRNFLGKLLFFLRKWMIPGVLRRYRGMSTFYKNVEDLREIDEFYSQDAKANLEGYYTTAARFLAKTLMPAILSMNVEIVKSRMKELTPREKANFRKLFMEVGMITLLWLAYGALDDEEDPDKNVFAKYLLRRQISELSFFASPPEALKIMSTPTAAMGTLKQWAKFIVQAAPQNISERYKQGAYEKDLKIYRKGRQIVPLMNIKDHEQFKQSLKFLNNMSF